MKNRYGDEYNFEKVNENTYKIVGNLKYWRFGGLEGQNDIDTNNLGFVDPSGGPFIGHGYLIESRPVTRIMSKDDGIFFEVK
jgi:hypothetical protein